MFSNVTTITLSNLSQCLAPLVHGGGAVAHTSAAALHARSSSITLTQAVNNLTALRALRRLVLGDLPVFPPGSWQAAGWRLECLRNLRRVTSLDLLLT